MITYVCTWMLDSIKKASLHEFKEVLMYTNCFQGALGMVYQFSDMELQKKIQMSMKDIRKLACDLRGERIPIRVPKFFLQIGLR